MKEEERLVRKKEKCLQSKQTKRLRVGPENNFFVGTKALKLLCSHILSKILLLLLKVTQPTECTL